MELGIFLRSLVIGLSVAAVVGPMSVLCIGRTVAHGWRYGFVSGLGIATADGLYGAVAAFGLTVVASFLVGQQSWVRLIGGLFLIYLGIRTLLTPPATRAAATPTTVGYVGAYLSTLGLTLTNPLTILSFVAIFAGIGIGSGQGGALAAVVTVLGVFAGSTAWWLALTGGVALVRTRFTPQWLAVINRSAGVIIAVFGIFALLSLRR
ncbi:MAG: LysE family transporter [Ktedonobacterales bacterium]|nr:LysE family transporter [Ktedonobacterales bacterium]